MRTPRHRLILATSTAAVLTLGLGACDDTVDDIQEDAEDIEEGADDGELEVDVDTDTDEG